MGENEEKKKLINRKYKGKFIYKSMEDEIKEFKNKYCINDISEDNEKIDISNRKGGDEMLKYLFLIITYKSKNRIKVLKLRNNKIKDPSLLNRINFNELKILDLSLNEITNLKFVLDMKAKNLKYLYLEHNYLNSIYPLLNANFLNLELLYLMEAKTILLSETTHLIL